MMVTGDFSGLYGKRLLLKVGAQKPRPAGGDYHYHSGRSRMDSALFLYIKLCYIIFVKRENNDKLDFRNTKKEF